MVSLRARSVLFGLSALVLLPGVAACSGGGGGHDGADAAVEPTVDGDGVSTSAPPQTLAPGWQHPVGELKWSTVELSAGCAEAVAPIRELMGRYRSGLVVTGADNEVITEALAAGRGACDAEEWARFQSDELLGWMNEQP